MKNPAIVLLCSVLALAWPHPRARAGKRPHTHGQNRSFQRQGFLPAGKFCLKGDTDPKATWQVADGVIKCTGKPNGYIRTEQAYHDYKVTVEWRFTKAGNTGVLVHMHEPDKVWPRCFECQGQHDKQGDFWMQGGAGCKGHHGTERAQRYVQMPGPSQENPVGEWNSYESVCAGNTIKIFVNGKFMNGITECTVSSGYVGQCESEGVRELEIRKVSIEPLPAD